MTDLANPQPGSDNAANAAQFGLQRIYLKDLSFESPLGVEGFKQNWQPKIAQDINTTANKVEDGLYEVILKLTVNVQVQDKTVFLVEVHQAGLFGIKGVEGPALAQLLNTMCPQILFPYAREVIDSCAIKGGFPALAIPPVNFDMLFARAVQEAQKAQKEKEEGATTN